MIPQIQAEGPQPASLLICGDFPSESDTYDRLPFAGQTGHEFSRILQEAGILRTACRVTMAYRSRPTAGNVELLVPTKKKDRTALHLNHLGKWCIPEVIDEIQFLEKEIQATKPTCIIACGTLALWVLTGKWSSPKWRGSCLETLRTYDFGDGTPPRKVKVIPTYSPGSVMAQWKWRPILIRDLKRALHESQTPLYDKPKYAFLVRPTYAQTLQTLDMLHAKVLKEPTKLSLDVETRAGYLACLGIAWSNTEAICIPLMTRTNARGYWSLDEEAKISWKLYQILTHSNAQCVGQNFIYDIQYFWRHLFFLPLLARDTMLAQHTCFSTMPKSLDYLASMYSAHYVYWKDEGKEWKPNDKSTEEEFWTYNCLDAIYTYEVDTVIQRVVDSMGLRAPHDFQQSMFWSVLETMNRGLRIDETFRKTVGNQMRAEMAEIQSYIDNLLGHPINLRSPAQLSKLFYKDLGLPLAINRKTGASSTDDEALHKIAKRESLMQPIVERILRFRSLGVFTSTFLGAKVGQDGRMRTAYNIGGTWTFRFSSREDAFGEGTNLQNQPEQVKKMYIPDPGMTFFDMDLDSADLRIVVAESGEENMAEWLDAGLKPYVMVAQEFYHDPSITKQHEAYKTFKALCHGTHYLGQPGGLAAQTGLPVKDVERIQAWYFKRFPKIRQWQERFKAQILARKSFSNIFGYKFHVLDRIGNNTYNECIAAVPQSTVAILVNKIYKNVFDNLPDVQVLLQTHDSISGQFPTITKEKHIADLKAQSQIILPYPKPIIIPTSFKVSEISYGDCK